VTRTQPRHSTLIVMAAVEVIYLVAATLWIGVVVAALSIGVRLVLKFRARRRRMNRFIDIVWIPVLLCTGQGQRRRSRFGRPRAVRGQPAVRAISSFFSESRS
jgi:hypothetical protein